MKTRSLTTLRTIARIFAPIALIACMSLTSCSERTYIEFDQTSRELSAEAQTFELTTNLPIQFIGVAIENGQEYVDCSYAGGQMECSREWFTVTGDNNGRKVTVTLNQNTGSSARKIKVQAISNGVAATCTLVQNR